MPDTCRSSSLPEFCAAVVNRHASAWPPAEDQLAREFLAHFGIARFGYFDGSNGVRKSASMFRLWIVFRTICGEQISGTKRTCRSSCHRMAAVSFPGNTPSFTSCGNFSKAYLRTSAIQPATAWRSNLGPNSLLRPCEWQCLWNRRRISSGWPVKSGIP